MLACYEDTWYWVNRLIKMFKRHLPDRKRRIFPCGLWGSSPRTIGHSQACRPWDRSTCRQRRIPQGPTATCWWPRPSASRTWCSRRLWRSSIKWLTGRCNHRHTWLVHVCTPGIHLHQVVCKDFSIPVANSYKTPWLDITYRPIHSYFKYYLLIFCCMPTPIQRSDGCQS